VKTGDLVKVNKMSDAGGLWDETGVVVGRKKRYEPGKHPLVEVLMNGNKHLFDYYHLDVINESR